MTGGQEGESRLHSVRRRYRTPLALAATALLAVSLIRHGAQGTAPPRPAAGDALSAGGAFPGVPGGGPAALGPSEPTEVRVPALGVDAPMTAVGDDGHGGVSAPPPRSANLAGWYSGSVTPGERGTAVVDGHVDTARGPAVFYGLGALHRGSTVEVVRADGGTAVFTVYGVEVFARKAFPGARVYGDTGHPELRLITCGGAYSRATGYQGNVVVFARLSSVRRPAAGPARPPTLRA